MSGRLHEKVTALPTPLDSRITTHATSCRGTKRRRCRSAGLSRHTVHDEDTVRWLQKSHLGRDTASNSRATRLMWKMTPASIAAFGISMLISGTKAAIPLTTTTTSTTINSDFITLFPNEHRDLQQDPFQQCKVALGAGDSNRDDTLGKDEYMLFVSILANKNLGEQDTEYTGLSSFDQLPQDLRDNYDKFNDVKRGGVDVSGFRPGTAATTEQDTQLKELCELTRKKILDSNGGLTPSTDPTSSGDPTPSDGDTSVVITSSTLDCSKMIDRGQCNVDLSISDSYQNDLLDESDYVKFVNRLSGNAYAGYRFEQLPENIKQNHKKFATKDRQVNISGSKPGDRVSMEQDAFIDAFCCETDSAVENPGVSITEVPASQPDGVGTAAPTFDPIFCQRSMASSDLQRSDELNKEEYVIFLNRLTNNEYIGKSYSDLNSALQANFENLAGDDEQVSIYGSKPDQKVISAEEEENLATICLETSYALNGLAPPTDAMTPKPTITPTSTPPNPFETPPLEPTVLTTLPPTFDENTCKTAISQSDINYDDYLDEEEYKTFVLRVTGVAKEGLTFNELPSPLPDTYYKLVSNNETGIGIYGAKPDQTFNDEQQAFLKRVCLDVAVAYSQTEGWTPPPAAAPSVPPGLSECYNSFIVSNKGGLSALDLKNGANRDGLDRAYNQFIEKAIDESDLVIGTLPPSTTRGRLRRRKLAVKLLIDSPVVYILEDSDCPEDLPSVEKCQTAFAKFQLTIDAEDPQTVSEVYTTYTQNLISQRFLEIMLNEVDSRNPLKIVNASYPVVPEPPTPAPTAAKEEGKKNRAGPIIGWLIGVILLCVIIAFVVAKRCPFKVKLPFGLEIPSFLNFFGGLGGKKGGREDDEGRLGFAQEDDDISASGKYDEGFGIQSNNPFGEDDDDDDDDDEEEQKDKNRFGFNRFKKKSGEPDNDFGLDSRKFASESFANTNDDIYDFEEPSEAGSVSEKDDQKSLGQSAKFGDSVASPTWGTDNVFGSDPSAQSTPTWGASQGSDNFFGTSTSDGKEKEAGSGSVSEDSESYSSDDDTYESGEMDESEDRSEQYSGEFGMEGGGQQESFSLSSADYSEHSTSLSDARMSSDLKLKNDDMDAAIDKGDWDAVVQATKSFGKSDIDSRGGSNTKGLGKVNVESEDEDDDDSYSDSYSGSGGSASSVTTTSEIREKRAEYRAQVEELVRIVLPDETEKVDAMMDQFKGREAELVSTLQTMEERSGNQRARAAVHKSKPPAQQQDTALTAGSKGPGMQGGEGSMAGTAAIAAASLPIPAEEMFDDEDQDDGFDDGFGDQNAFEDGGEDQYDNEGSEYSESYDGEERSYYSDEEGSGARSFYSEEQGSATRSFYDDEGSQPGSAYNEEEQRSFYSQEQGSAERSFYSQEDEEGSRTRSFYSEEEGSGVRSFYSQDEEGSLPPIYNSQEEGSASKSYYSQEGSRSYYSDEGSYCSGQDPEEGSFFSDEGSQNDQD
mmetsp:Transcript_26188/g.71855  ORF Transcript_26188/g.71855 Transcript_26188/m.71855 type:complete len:1481 (-) Transcript_26188:73-4515(-)